LVKGLNVNASYRSNTGRRRKQVHVLDLKVLDLRLQSARRLLPTMRAP